MGEIVRLRNCREVSPELSRAIARRTKNASYWVRYWATYWSVVNCIADDMFADEVNERAIEDVRLCVLGWLHDRNRAALKARGF